MVTFQRRNSIFRIVEYITGIILTYTVNEFVSPRVKFLPKAAPVDCALLLSTLTRHFLSLSAGHQHAKRKRDRQRERARLCVEEEIAPEGNAHRLQSYRGTNLSACHIPNKKKFNQLNTRLHLFRHCKQQQMITFLGKDILQCMAFQIKCGWDIFFIF